MQNSRLRGRPPPIIFARIVRPMNALLHCRSYFSHKETLQQTFLKRSAIIDGKRHFCGFDPHLWGLRATYDDHLRLIGKCVVDLLFVLIKLFRQMLQSRRYERKQIENRRFRSNAVSLTQNFRQSGTFPTNHFCRIVRPMNALQFCRRQFSHE